MANAGVESFVTEDEVPKFLSEISVAVRPKPSESPEGSALSHFRCLWTEGVVSLLLGFWISLKVTLAASKPRFTFQGTTSSCLPRLPNSSPGFKQFQRPFSWFSRYLVKFNHQVFWLEHFTHYDLLSHVIYFS